MNGFIEGGGRVIVCQRECEAERHEWGERKMKNYKVWERERERREREEEKKGIDEIEGYVE